MSVRRLKELSAIIAAQTDVLDAHITSNNLAQPSFAPDAPAEPIQNSNSDIDKAKRNAIEAAIELRQLLEGPVKSLLPDSNFAPLASVYNFNISSHVPFSGSVSFAELADKCGLLENDLRRVIRYTAAHHRVFCEPRKGYVAHTAASKMLKQNAKIRDVMGLTFAECWPAHGRAMEAMAKKSEEPNMSGYALANNTDLNMFEFLAQHPERAKRFAGAMSSTSQASLDALSNYFDWANLPIGSSVVDVGGAQGHVSIDLATRFPHLRFIVQDLAQVINSASTEVPETVKDRVILEAHDMFTEQTIKGADVYLLRYVMHDWPDKYCIKVLSSLIPALKKGAKVVVQDHLLPEPGTLGLLQEMQIRSMDAIMLSLFNSREREEEDWQSLFRRAGGERFAFKATRIKDNPSTGIIVAEWLEEA